MLRKIVFAILLILVLLLALNLKKEDSSITNKDAETLAVSYFCDHYACNGLLPKVTELINDETELTVKLELEDCDVYIIMDSTHIEFSGASYGCKKFQN